MLPPAQAGFGPQKQFPIRVVMSANLQGKINVVRLGQTRLGTGLIQSFLLRKTLAAIRYPASFVTFAHEKISDYRRHCWRDGL